MNWTRWLIRNVGWYGPYLGAGIRVKSMNQDMTQFIVELRMRWYNRNLFGTHFGGSLYAMCDPFYVFILVNYLGKDYIVWDKSATIRFKMPGKGSVQAIFEISPAVLAEIKQEINIVGRKTYFFTTVVKDASGNIIAEVEKEVYVKKK